MANVIFDLDGTVIDSSHRHATNSDGSIDLAHWFENATREKIMADSLLPLAKVMISYFEQGHRVIICTARCFSQADYDFLFDNAIPYDYLLTRQGRFVGPDSPEFADSYHGFIGDGRGDGEMKTAMLTELALSLGYSDLAAMDAIMFDDNLRVIQAMLDARVTCYNAIEINDLLGRSDLPYDVKEFRKAA
jgi:hypothetical protein